MDLQGANVLVVGVGLSGVGAVHLLHNHGANIVLLEQNEKTDEIGIREKLMRSDRDHVKIVIGSLPDEMKENVDLVVLSPAVPTDIPLVEEFREREIPVYSEVELAFQFEKGQLLAITGTNGKTTTTTLVGEIMRAYREKVFVVGNIGYSYAAVADETTEKSVSVGEISSFQLECIHKFHPVVSAILNITPDHLNRHYTIENYAAIKEKIAKYQTEEEVCVLNYEDPYLYAYGMNLCPANVVWFSSKRKLYNGFYLEGDRIVRAERGNVTEWMNIHDMKLVGVCNVENVMAAMAMTAAAGVPRDTIISVVKNFRPVAHRIEFVAAKRGVDYYNDSKATNPDAAIQGIRAMDRPTILIGGGYDKDNTYDEWIEAFDQKVKELVLIGQTREAIAACARNHGFEAIHFCDTFEECLQYCTEKAEEGDAVLLSPACASWGMFPNYEVRGDIFKEYVNGLDE